MRLAQLCLACFLILLAACDQPAEVPSEVASVPAAAQRWYSEEQVLRGAEVFAQNCAVCHGPKAEGLVADWRERLPDGSFPPPPLDGSAHAWHHPRDLLVQVINDGGAAFGGQMPGFADVLADTDKLAAIAYFQSFWSDDIYADWLQMGGVD